MRITALLALVFLFAATVHAQARRRPVQARDQNLDVWEPLMNAPLQPDANPGSARPGNPVPVSQLRIPSKAIREYERSHKAFRSGDVHASAEHLQKALQIYPDFLQAHNELGLRFIQLRDYQKALAEHELALSLDARNAHTHQDLSFALLALNRAGEAETEARLALELDSQAVIAQYLLGRALVAQQRVTQEAVEMLRQSENAFPDASLVLAQIHFRAGETEQLIADLRQYLRAPSDADNKQKAECWLAELRTEPVANCAGLTMPPSFH